MIRTFLADLRSPGGNIHAKHRLVLEAILDTLEACYFRQHEAFMATLFQNYPAKTKQDINRLPGDVRYLRKEIFCALLGVFSMAR